MTLRAGLYTRLSSDPRGIGRSVKEQDADGRADIARNGWTLVHVYCDNNRSASQYASRDREEFAKLLVDIRARRLDVIVAWEASRFTRDTKVYLQLAEACIENDVLYSYNGRVLDLADPDDAFSAGLDNLLDVREAGKTRKRILRTQRFAALAGQPHGMVPYGYRRVYDQHTGSMVTQVPDEATAPVVRELFERFLTGESMQSICRGLNERGVSTPRGGAAWNGSSIRVLLKRRGYTGVRTWNGEVMTAGGWPPLVSEEDFARAQAILADPRRARNNQSTQLRHLLSGILTCGHCDGRMVASRPNDVPSYVCEARSCVARQQVMVEPPLVRLLTARLADPALGQALGAQDGSGALLERVRGIDDEIAALEVAVETGELSARMATAEERRLVAVRDQVSQELLRTSPLPGVVLRVAGPGAQEAWEHLDLADQRVVVRALFSSLRVLRKKGQAQIGRRDAGLEIQWTGSDERHLLL